MSVPFKQIDSFEFPVTNVVAIARRTGWRAWLRPGYDVFLIQGVRLRLTTEQKSRLDDALDKHQATLQVLGMVSAMKR